MKTVQLQIEDDFYDEFLETLPRDKVTVLDQFYIDNQNKFVKELDSFKSGAQEFTSHLENMKEIDSWLKEAEENANS